MQTRKPRVGKGLTISRREMESLIIRVGGRTVTITPTQIGGRRTRLNVQADPDVEIFRSELLKERRAA